MDNLLKLIATIESKQIKMYLEKEELKFHAPKGVMTKELLNQIKENKEKIIAFLKSSKAQEQSALDVNAKFGYESKIPLTTSQQRLWFLNKYADGNEFKYNLPMLIKVSGEIDPICLEKAMHKICLKHQALRTTFFAKGNSVQQIIHDDIQLHIPTKEFSGSLNDEVIFAQIKKPFDLQFGPLIRTTLFTEKGNPCNSYILIVMHHIISDGWSCDVLFHEISEIYSALVSKKTPVVEQLKVQYSDIALAEEEDQNSEQSKHALDVLAKELEDYKLLNFYTDSVKKSDPALIANKVEYIFDMQLCQEIDSFLKRCNITPYIFFSAVTALVLSRFCNQNDVLFASPISLRDSEDTWSMIGFFVNTMVLRLQIDETMSIQEYFAYAKQKALQMLDYKNTPINKIIDRLDLDRHDGETSLYNVMCSYNETNQEALPFGKSLGTIEPISIETIKAMLTIDYQKSSQGYSVSIKYNPTCFYQSTIERFSNWIVQTIRYCIAHIESEDCLVKQIEIMDTEEKDVVLYQFNNTQAPYPEEKTLIERFEDQVDKTPDNIAVRTANQSLTYRELNERANYIANVLHNSGVIADDIIGIITSRSIEMMVGIYGILKAGAAYMPIDPNHPAKRIEYMLEDSKAKFLLVGKVESNVISELETKAKIFDLTLSKNQKKAQGSHYPCNKNNIAYVIYTSGTTGNPKGVLIENHSIINRLHWMQKKYPLDQNDVILQKTTYTFDVSVWELFWWGQVGASVYLCENNAEKDPDRLIENIRQSHATVIHFVPSMFEIFLLYATREETAEKLKSLKHIFTSGEALSLKSVNDFSNLRKRGIRAHLHNLYGPTETAVDSTYYECTDLKNPTLIPIGKPIDNTQIYILQNEKLNGILMPGELCISGTGVSRGYLNLPEVVKQKFIKNPYAPGRIYRTGDLARWLPDGNIEYLGRIDEQVKIRGFRIEIKEIEQQMLAFEGVLKAIVTIKETKTQGKLLVAYFTSEKNIAPDKIAAFLKESLPYYMVPSSIIHLDEIPLTPNGKLNRKALPSLEAENTNTYHAPSNECERIIVEIFQKLLENANIGVNDDFFEAGGNSLVAMQLVYMAREQGLHFTPKEIFDLRTPKKLALASSAFKSHHPQELMTGKFSLIPSQEWFFAQKFAEPNYFNQSILLTIENSVKLDQTTLQNALNKVLYHYDSLRLRFRKENNSDQIYQEYSEEESAFDFPLEIVSIDEKQSAHEQQSQFTQCCHDAQTKLDIQAGPVIRAVLFRYREKSTLFVTAHRLVLDYVSWNIFLSALNKAYDQLQKNQECNLPLKSSSFAQWCSTINSMEESFHVVSQKPYYLEMAELVQTDKSQKDILSLNKKSKFYLKDFKNDVIQISDSVKELKNSLKRPDYPDMRDIIVGVLAASIRQWKEVKYPVFQLEGHGRLEERYENIDLTNTIGGFAINYPVVVSTSENLSNLANDDQIFEWIKASGHALRKSKNQGMDLGLIYRNATNEEKKQLEYLFKPLLTFNYFAQIRNDNLQDKHATFHLCNDFDINDTVSPRNHVEAPIECICYIEEDNINILLSYHSHSFSKEQINDLKKIIESQFSYFAKTCLAKANTPSFPTFQAYEKLHQSQEEYNAVVSFHRNGKHTPLFFIHPGQGGSEVYLALADLLDNELPFYTIESHNLYGPKPYIDGIENMASFYRKLITDIQPTGPYRLGGWCLGGLLSVEIAKQFKELGQTVEVIYALDTFAYNEKERAIVKKYEEENFLIKLLAYDPLFRRFPEEHKNRMIEVSNLEYKNLSEYIPVQYDGEMILFKALQKQELPENLDANVVQGIEDMNFSMMPKMDNGWNNLAKNLTIYPMHATHNTMMEGEHLEYIAEVINNDLNKRDKISPLPSDSSGSVNHSESETKSMSDNAAPRNQTEKAIVKIFEKELGVDKIGIHDNFFEIGCNSILIAKIAFLINQKFNTSILLSEFWEHPTIAHIAKIIAKAKKSDETVLLSIPHDENRLKDSKNTFPLSLGQQRLWYEHYYNLKGGENKYNIPFAIDLQGELHCEALEKACNRIIEENLSFRTIFPIVNSTPRQMILPYKYMPLKISKEMIRFSDAQIKDFLSTLSNNTFDLEKGPLYTFTLFEIGNSHWVFYCNMHHIITDGYSVRLLIKSLQNYYNDYVKGESASPVSASTNAVNYLDYSCWQNKMLKKGAFDKQLHYWSKKLRGYTGFNLPFKANCLQQSGNHYDAFSFKVNGELFYKLQKFNQKNNVTEFTTLITAYYLLLMLYSGKNDIVVTIPVSNRYSLDHVMGFFINMIFVRLKVEENLTFLQLFSKMQHAIIEAFENQDVPLDNIVKELNNDNGLGFESLSQTVFNMFVKDTTITNPNIDVFFDPLELKLTDLDISNAPLTYHNAKSQMDIYVGTVCDAYNFVVEYDSSIYSLESIQSFFQNYISILHNIIDQPEQTLVNLPSYIHDNEIEKVIYKFNCEKPVLATAQTVTEQFVHIAEQYKDKTALIEDDQQVSYGRLYEMAKAVCNNIIQRLTKQEQVKQPIVGIYLENKIQFITSILGSLLAGCAYIPLSMRYPADRIMNIVNASNMDLFITKNKLLEQINISKSIFDCVDVLDYDTLGWSNTKSSVPLIDIDSHSTAYIIYTSGTTGIPKGVAIDHKSMLNIQTVDELIYKETDIIGSFLPFCFDGSYFDLWGALLHGSSLVLIEEDDVLSVDKVRDVFSKYPINKTLLSTTIFNLYAEQLYEELSRMEAVFFGGETANSTIVQKFSREHGNVKIYNLYGPTETTVLSTYCPVHELDFKQNEIPIGKPLPGNLCYVLDDKLKPRPIGAEGILYIGGIGVSKGYLNHDELNKKMFCKNPFFKPEYEELGYSPLIYKTNDIVKWDNDGALHFIGRADSQIKIRGYRIELEDISANISSYPGIKGAVTLPLFMENMTYLESYIVANNSQKLDVALLHKYLKEKLPSYMLPQYYYFVDYIPMSTNAKLDTKKLKQMRVKAIVLNDASEKVQPTTETEKTIQKIWKQLMKHDEIFIDDNFFSIGGHSLMAMRLCILLNQTFNISLYIQDIYTRPTIRELAQYIDSIKNQGNKSTISFENFSNDQKPWKLIPEQNSILFLEQLYKDVEGLYNVLLCFEVSCQNHFPKNYDALLENAYNKALHSFDIFHCALEKQDREFYMQPLDTPNHFEVKTIHVDSMQELNQQLSAAAQMRLDIENGIFAQFYRFVITNKKEVFLFVFHHFISDGISMKLFLEEFSKNYNHLVSGEEIKVTSSVRYCFSQYAKAKNEWLRTKHYQNMLKEYSTYYKDTKPLKLPFDNIKTGNEKPLGKHHLTNMSQSLMKQLTILAKNNNTSVFITLLSVYFLLLYKYTGQDDIIVGTPVSLRDNEQFQDIMGYCINTIPLRVKIPENISFTELISRVKQSFVSTISFKNIPFSDLVEKLHQENSSEKIPLICTMFMYENEGSLDGITFKDLEAKNIYVHTNISKMDLTFRFTPIEQGDTDCTYALEIEYNTNLLQQDTIERMSQYFIETLNNILSNPDQNIDRINSADITNAPLFGKTVALPEKSIADMLFDAMDLFPNQIAIVDHNESLRYFELQQNVCQLSNALLKTRKNYKDQPIAICLNRGINAFICILSVLTVGGAYVIIDPSYPAQRVQYIVDDLKPTVFITDQQNIKCISPNGEDTTQILPDDCKLLLFDPEALKEEACTRPHVNVCPNDLAYIVYTSGSSGAPKGVMVEQANVINFITYHQKLLNIKSSDRVCQQISLNFDASVAEYLPILTKGGSLYICDNPTNIEEQKYQQFYKENGITLSGHVTPLLPFLPCRDDYLLRALWTGGSVLQKELSDKWAENYNLLNVYGPTETTVYSTSKIYTGNIANIGTPIDNTIAYIVDEKGNLLPHGVKGELCISGLGVARGYWGKTKLTQEKFQKNPFNTTQNTVYDRIYHTGDIAKIQDGDLIYCGRIDNQVKFHGYRIELEEIESAINGIDGIVASCVIISKINDQEHLVAYCVKEKNITDEKSFKKAILGDLKKKLPAPMIPVHYIFIDQFSYTINGKIDKESLPSLTEESISGSNQEEYVAPSGEIELALAEIFKTDLKQKQISAIADYFQMGGSSLLTMKTISAINNQFDLHLKISDLYTYKTIKEMATYINLLKNRVDSQEDTLLEGEEEFTI